MFDEFFAKGQELWQTGKPFATATVVRAERPTSGKPGDKAIITADGKMFGWIGGSCAEPTVIQEALDVLETGEGKLIRLSTQPEAAGRRGGITDLPMTCYSGGTMEIYIEPHQPRLRLIVVGGQHVAKALVHLGRAMGYETVSVVPESEASPLPEADHHSDELEAIPDLVTPNACVVVATHGHYDELALEPALKSGASYVGLVASRKRAESVIEFLEGRGLCDRHIAALHVPAGLDIGARRGDEIALSILAEIVQHKRRTETDPRARKEEAAPTVDTAIDPICNMTVQIEGALHTFAYEGTTYYFCCPGCKSRFAADPQKVLEAMRS